MNTYRCIISADILYIKIFVWNIYHQHGILWTLNIHQIRESPQDPSMRFSFVFCPFLGWWTLYTWLIFMCIYIHTYMCVCVWLFRNDYHYDYHCFTSLRAQFFWGMFLPYNNVYVWLNHDHLFATSLELSQNRHKVRLINDFLFGQWPEMCIQ